MRKTAATLTLADPSQMSSKTTTHTTGVDFTATSGGLATTRTMCQRAEASAREMAAT